MLFLALASLETVDVGFPTKGGKNSEGDAFTKGVRMDCDETCDKPLIIPEQPVQTGLRGSPTHLKGCRCGADAFVTKDVQVPTFCVVTICY